MKRWLPVFLMATTVVVVLIIGRGTTDNSPAARAERIASGIKCPTCQGLSVAQSKAGSAAAIYGEIKRRVDQGESDASIRAFLVSRYGSEQLLLPEATGISSVAWIAPVFVFVAGLGGVVLLSFRRRKGNVLQVPTEDDLALVEQARAADSR